MKKISIIFLVLALAFSIAACGRRDNSETNMPATTTPSTDMTILPDPTIGTNIPDPEVDTSMPMYTESTGTNAETDSTSNSSIGIGG